MTTTRKAWWSSAAASTSESQDVTITQQIDDSKQYRVQLKERMELFGQTLYPGHDVVLRGDVLKTVADKVEHAEPV